MTWDQEFSDLKKARRRKAAAPKPGAEDALRAQAADYESVQRHIRDVVMPVFADVADAARKSGYYASADMIVAQPGGPRRTRASFAMGALLGLSAGQPLAGEPFHAYVRLVHSSGTIYTLSQRAPDFNRTDGASLDELTEARLCELIREVLASTFG